MVYLVECQFVVFLILGIKSNWGSEIEDEQGNESWDVGCKDLSLFMLPNDALIDLMNEWKKLLG